MPRGRSSPRSHPVPATLGTAPVVLVGIAAHADRKVERHHLALTDRAAGVRNDGPALRAVVAHLAVYGAGLRDQDAVRDLPDRVADSAHAATSVGPVSRTLGSISSHAAIAAISSAR